MNTYESYTEKYSKQKDHKNIHSNSAHKFQKIQNIEPNTIGNVVAKLTNRIDGVQIKIISLTNIVKLLQKYTQTKDQQYEKEKENIQFKSFIDNNGKQIDKNKIDFQSKVKQFQILTRRLKHQIDSVQNLKTTFKFQISSSQKNIQTNYKNQTKPKLHSTQIDQLLQDMQQRLRDQLNRKIQICMNTFKALTLHQQNQKNQNQTLNRVMLEQQIHNLTLMINKIQNITNNNNLKNQSQIQALTRQVSKINLKSYKNQRSLSPISHHSNKSISKTKIKNQELILNQKKKVKEGQLKEAIRKKKQAKEKLKAK